MVWKAILQAYTHDADTNTAWQWQVMNEIALHRGSSPHLNTIDIYVDGQHLTEAVVRFNSSKHRALLITVVGRCDCVHTYRINGILALSWRAHRTSLLKCRSSRANMSAKFIIPTTRIPVIFIRDFTCESLSYLI
jgi:hypothetical protein